MMAAAAGTRARGGGQPRRPFAPVVVSPPPPAAAASASQAENRLAAREDAPRSEFARREPRRLWKVAAGPAGLGGGNGMASASAKKPGPGSSSPGCVSSKKTPAAAAKRAPGAAARRRLVGSCAKNKKCSTPAAGAVAACDSPRAAVTGGDEARAEPSFPCIEAADQERRGSEASASPKRAMAFVTMEEAMAGLPEPGEGRVKYIVDTFERLFSLAAGGGGLQARSRGAARRRHGKNEATVTGTVSCPATPRGAEVIDVSSYPSSEVFFPAIPGVGCILDASDRTRISRVRGQRRQRPYNSNGSSDRAWSCSRKVTRLTAQRPFRLRTEQRGKAKEENFLERLSKMEAEQERLRHPVAQGLPYTTDEPEIPTKPPTKEPTEPINLVLHSDVRGVKRVEFDSQVAERNSFMEEVKLERERQQKVDEEIEIKQLRKELVPRAHPVPDFSRPFVPKRSAKLPTIPREPRFQSRLMRHISKER